MTLDKKHPGTAGTMTGADTAADARESSTASSTRQAPFDHALSLKLDAIEARAQALREEGAP